MRNEKKRTIKKDLATNIREDMKEMKVSWSGDERVASD